MGQANENKYKNLPFILCVDRSRTLSFWRTIRATISQTARPYKEYRKITDDFRKHDADRDCSRIITITRTIRTPLATIYLLL